jgi:type IV secretion system protein VirB5
MSIQANRLLILSVALIAGAPAAHAQFAVIDIASVTQLITEVQTLEQQLATARDHLAQAQTEFQSITGGRGMEQLLAGTVRNYLPADWTEFQGALQSASSAYGALSTEMRNAIRVNALLSAQQLAGLSAAASQQLQSERQSVAVLQALAHEALTATSHRFASIQQLIDAIPRAGDQKAILDLQARIGAEAGMLENEQTKLQVLYQSAQADHWANEQRTRERVIAGHGTFDARFRPVP